MNDSAICLLDSAHGQYIPQSFVELYNADEWGISEEDAEILLSGPDHEWYWETWEEVLNSAEFTDNNGNKYCLHQDGDLWAYCIERMTLEEQRNLFQPFSICEYYVPDGFMLFEVGEQFICPLYYGELDGLSEQEVSALGVFVCEYGGDITDSMDYNEFGECEITGMRGRTCLVVIRNKAGE